MKQFAKFSNFFSKAKVQVQVQDKKSIIFPPKKKINQNFTIKKLDALNLKHKNLLISSGKETKNYLKIFFIIKKFVNILKTKATKRHLEKLHSLHFNILADKTNFGNPFENLNAFQLYVKKLHFLSFSI